ncbi:MAG: hypothetical protein AAF668_10765 [Pseudomonadota bacterium]
MYDYGDWVRVIDTAPRSLRPGETGSVIAILEGRKVPTYRTFKSNLVYMIEFEDGEAIDIEDLYLERIQ